MGFTIVLSLRNQSPIETKMKMYTCLSEMLRVEILLLLLTAHALDPLSHRDITATDFLLNALIPRSAAYGYREYGYAYSYKHPGYKCGFDLPTFIRVCYSDQSRDPAKIIG